MATSHVQSNAWSFIMSCYTHMQQSSILGTVSNAKCTEKILKLVEHRNQATKFIFNLGNRCLYVCKYTADLCDGIYITGFFIFTI